METCRQCGASVPEGDERCPSCGAARQAGEEEPPRLAIVRSSGGAEGDAGAEIDDVGSEVEDDDDERSVPAGTWASAAGESDAPPPASFGEPETRRIRRALPDATAALEPAAVREARAEPTGAIRRVRGGEPVGRGRERGLAIAAAPQEMEPAARSDTQRRQARVVAFPGGGRAADATGPTPATASSSGMRANLSGEIAVPSGPPRWLASELLRERPPAEPYAKTSRAVAILSGVGGAIAAAILGGEGGVHLGIAALLAAIATSAVVPLRFPMRAGAFAVLASIGLVIATMARSRGAGGEIEGLATMGTTLLAAAQLLRSEHRTSKFARAAMGVGIAVTTAWLLLGGGLDAMVVHRMEIDAWLGPSVRALLLVVLAMSVLGFLDDGSDSGCRVWPWLVLGWSALDGVVAIATGTAGSEIAAIATPLFSAIAAFGWMQVWATTPGLGREPGRAARTES